jgi:hypothetical protein
VFPLKNIAEAFNEYNRFTGTSKLGFRLKNGKIVKGIVIRTIGDYLVGLGTLGLANMHRKTNDEWVAVINSLISNESVKQ